MTAGVLVIGLVVGLFAGARWARARRALGDMRGAKAGAAKARDAWRQARSAAALGLTVVALYLLAIATGVITFAER